MTDTIQYYGAESAVTAMSKQEFFALAEARIRASAGSGFSEWGNHLIGTGFEPVNDGIWSWESQPNRLMLGRESGSGVSRTANPIGVVNGVSLAIQGVVHTGQRTQLTLPNAPDGTKTYDSATGVVTQHVDSATAFAAETETKKVITSRQDYICLEVFHRVLDGATFYPNGMVQNGVNTFEGMSLSNTVDPQGFAAFGEWDTDTKGYGKNWDSMNIFEKGLAIQARNSNIYSDNGVNIQVCGRIRVIEGHGDDWDRVIPTDLAVKTTQVLRYDVMNNIAVRGTLTTNSDWSSNAGNGFGGPQNSGAYNFLEGTHKGLCISLDGRDNSHTQQVELIPIALVQRRNSGAYHPSFNKNGCDYTEGTGGTGAYLWYSSSAYQVNSMLSCFTNNFGTRGKIGQLSGRTNDGKYYDAIYASDVEDLRMSSNRKPKKEVRVKYNRMAKSGDARGFEGVPFTKFFVVSKTTSLTSTPYSLKLPEVNVDGDYSWLGSSNTPCAGSVIVNGVAHKVTNAKLAGGDVFLVSPTFSSSGEAGSQIIEACIAELSNHKQANPTWTSLIGDPADILAMFPNGIEGTWIPVIPDGTSLVYPMTRKCENYISSITTDNNGLTYTNRIGGTREISIESTANAMSGLSIPTGRIEIVHYETKAHFTEDAVNSTVKDMGDVYVTCANAISNGNLLSSSLTGVINTTELSSSREQEELGSPYGYTYYTDDKLDTLSGQSLKHRDVGTNIDGSTAVKVVNYLTSALGTYNVHFLYKGMMYDTTTDAGSDANFINRSDTDTTLTVIGDYCHITDGTFQGYYRIVNDTSVAMAAGIWSRDSEGNITDANGDIYFELWDGNGFGDDNKFQVISNQESFTDDNGNTGVRGTAKLKRGIVQYFSTED